MREVEKAYLAGIVDGEGTVTLTRQHKNETPTPNVIVSNTNLPLLQWIKSKVGGVIITKQKYMPHHKVCYAWSVKQNRALHLLDEIQQYLIIKKQQAELIIATYKKVTHRAGKYTQEMLKQKEELVRKIRKLNQQ